MMPIEEVIKNTKRISLKDYVCFTCTGCGECCRQVKESVALEPLDVFKITQFLRTRDPSIRCIEDVLDRYTVPIFLTETGYMMFPWPQKERTTTVSSSEIAAASFTKENLACANCIPLSQVRQIKAAWNTCLVLRSHSTSKDSAFVPRLG